MKEVNRIINRVIKVEDFYGKRFKPSIQTTSSFLKVFNIIYKDFSNFIEIKNLEWNRDEFNIMLVDKSCGEILQLKLADNFGIKKCNSTLCTNNICTGVHYEIQNDNFLKFLVHFIVKGTNFKFNDFIEILTKDLKAKKEYYQIFWKSERPPFSIIQNWGYELHKYRFFAQEGVMRNMDQSISLNLPEASIHHSERECQGISPNNKNKGYHFFNFPNGYYNHSFDKYYYLTDSEKDIYLKGNNIGYGMGLSTDLDEEDVVMGKGTDKLSKAISYVVDNLETNNIKVISFNCCCVPRIIGDDIYSVLKKAKEKTKIPFIFQGQLEKTPYEQKIQMLLTYFNKIDKDRVEKIAKSISLFGYHENIYQKFLGDLLKENGIKINTSFFPSIDVRLLEMLYKSELFVFSPNNFQKEGYEYPFQSMGIKYIKPKYPYGLKYTKEWISDIFSEFGMEYSINDNTNNIIIQYNKYVDYVKKNNLTVGIILIGKKELEKFINPDYMNNIDILYFLEEMGFKINLYIYDNFKSFPQNNDDSYKISDGNHEDILNIIKSKSNNIKTTFFSGDSDFKNFIETDKLDLVYSDIYFDDRLSNKGINQFNLKNFYLGFEGALDTIKGFIKLSGNTFYKNYYKYFDN